MFKAAYDSVWHHPGAAWLTAMLLLAWLLAERRSITPFMNGFLAIFAVEIAVDAYFTGGLAPKSVTSIEWRNLTAAITFVIVGDYRFYVLVERFAPARAPAPTSLGPLRAWLVAVPWAFLVPLSWTFVYKTGLIVMPDLYFKFLVYEIMFLVVAVVLRFVWLPARLKGTPPEARRYVLALATYEVVQYGLWALADVVIRTGHGEAGYLLRIVPNVMYYGGFLLFAWRIAPAEIRGGARSAAVVA